MDLLLEDAKNPQRRLHKLLKPLAEDYDYVFLDCPPSISLVSENVFHAADALLIPVIPTPLSNRTLAQLLSFHREQGIDAIALFPFFSMVDRRKALHRELVDTPSVSEVPMLQSLIPYSSEVEKMGTRLAPLPAYAPRSKAGQAFSALWDEVRARLEALQTG